MDSSFVSQCLTQSAQQSVVPNLRPIGIFWDIENCNVPFNRSVIKLVENIRQFIFNQNFRESEFLVVCDTYRANKELLDDLNSSQVTVVHVSSTAKNAADDKLKQQIIRFIESNGHHSAVLVLTDDINFACVLSDLRNRSRVEIILIQRQASPALKTCADTVIDFKNFCKNLPVRSKEHSTEPFIIISNLPINRRALDLKKCLLRLVSNCGGKKIDINCDKAEAIIRFGCLDDAKRAKQRIDGHEIFGFKIRANLRIQEVLTESSDNSDSSVPENTSTAVDTTEMPISRSRNYSHPIPDLHFNELMPYCAKHSTRNSRFNWSDTLSSTKMSLPMVHISMQVLATRLHHLLDTHAGGLALNSFTDCYFGEFNELFNTEDKPLVALEHLITCVPGVCISISPTNYVRRITWIQNRNTHYEESIYSEPNKACDQTLANHLSHFGKEVRELLKSQMHTIIPFNKFVPSYHTHFVRQLCVGYYGCQKLSELLDEIPNIIQVYGENDDRMITLTHREQTKRFASDLIKVLKAQNGRRIKLSQFSEVYESVFQKPFDVCDYGVCYLEDILNDVWEGTVIMTPFGTTDQWIEIPKRDRTSEQIRRTIYFTQEVIELLSCSKEVIDFELTFSKFIPCYHRYFNKQCRVSDYGFTKLIELLEELSPKVLEIESSDKCGEKQVRLNYDNRVKTLIYRFESILKTFESRSISIGTFEYEYCRKFKTNINYSEYYANDLIDLIDKMPNNKFRITQTQKETKIFLLDSDHFKTVAKRVVRLLMEESNAELSLVALEKEYLEHFGDSLATHVLSGEFKEAFVVNSQTNSVGLSEMFLFCRQCIQTMQSIHKKKLTIDELDRELMRRYEQPLPQPNYYKCCSFPELFDKFFDFFHIEKRKTGKYLLLISLDQSFHKKPLVVKPPVYQILKRPTPDVPQKVTDLMNSEVPESLPLPDLVPALSPRKETDLIHWSSETSDSSSDNCPNLMDFTEITEVLTEPNVSHCWPDSCESTSSATCGDAHELHSKYNGFKITNGFRPKKSRIIANLS